MFTKRKFYHGRSISALLYEIDMKHYKTKNVINNDIPT